MLCSLRDHGFALELTREGLHRVGTIRRSRPLWPAGFDLLAQHDLARSFGAVFSSAAGRRQLPLGCPGAEVAAVRRGTRSQRRILSRHPTLRNRSAGGVLKQSPRRQAIRRSCELCRGHLPSLAVIRKTRCA